METVNVNLKENSYPIYIGENILNQIATYIRKLVKTNKINIITDSNVSKLYLEGVRNCLINDGYEITCSIIPAGESSKNLYTIENLLDECYKNGLLRDSIILSLGGGVVGDIAGFVSSIYMRGIGFMQIPTTLLAQVDSSVGGKTGVNLKYGKNIAGTFYQPYAVFIDINTLRTLDKREILGGLSEIIKYGIIYDINLFTYIENNLSKILNLNNDVIEYLIKKTCEIKAYIVSKDEKENDLRMILNYGHTIGHALEALTEYKKYIHGEAIAIGMVYEAKIALNRNYIDVNYFYRIKNLISSAGLPTSYCNLDKNEIIRLIRHDKKNRHNNIKFILPIEEGKVKVCNVEASEILNALKF